MDDDIEEHVTPAARIWKRKQDGRIHNPNGPAVTYIDGAVEYWIDGKLHRLDGPAYVGDAGNRWWINDYYVNTLIKEWAEKFNIDLENLTEDDKILIRLYWENYDGDE